MRCLLALPILFGLLSCISFPAAERARYERQFQKNNPAKRNSQKSEPRLFGLPKTDKAARDSPGGRTEAETEAAPPVKTKKNHKDPYFRPS